jgi:hypothetical protein
VIAHERVHLRTPATSARTGDADAERLCVEPDGKKWEDRHVLNMSPHGPISATLAVLFGKLLKVNTELV